MKTTNPAYPNALFQRTLLLFILYFSISYLAAQRTISGKVFSTDGTEQLGGYVSIDRSLVHNTVLTGLEGFYVIEVPDSTKSLYFYWDGTINSTVPIGNEEEVNVINNYLYVDFPVDYPTTRITRSIPTMVSGVVMDRGKPKSGVKIIPMESENQELPGVKTDDGGQFHLAVPPEATALKLEDEWQIQYFVIPNVKSIYIPVEVNVELLTNLSAKSKRSAKRLKRQWKRKNRKINNP
jgi:hypothetical protein